MLNQIMKPHVIALLAALTLFSANTPADEFALNPQVKKVVDDVSEQRIAAIIQHLVTFGTRNTMSNPDAPDHGVGAARQWILSEMKSYSPRLQVRFDKWHIKKNGQRIFKDIDLYNVVAVLPGKTMPETQPIRSLIAKPSAIPASQYSSGSSSSSRKAIRSLCAAAIPAFRAQDRPGRGSTQ